ncbi:MAG: DNA polymerase III subunit alpha [Deltaproteobacteria bacterium]
MTPHPQPLSRPQAGRGWRGRRGASSPLQGRSRGRWRGRGSPLPRRSRGRGAGGEGSPSSSEIAPPRLLLLAKDAQGYRHLCRLSTLAHARELPAVSWEELEAHAGGLFALTGDDAGLVTRALGGEPLPVLDRLISAFGRESVLCELQRHGDPREERRNRAVRELARLRGLRVVATQGARMAAPEGRPLLDVLTAIRAKTTLDRAGTLLCRNAERHLRAEGELRALFADIPEALDMARAVAHECGFTLRRLPYRFPDFQTPEGESQPAMLRRLVREGAQRRYPKPSARVSAQLERELTLIEKLGLSGYFLIVADIVRFCGERQILGKGRGSAANSAVCYALDITTVDPVGNGLLFERFLSEERAGASRVSRVPDEPAGSWGASEDGPEEPSHGPSDPEGWPDIDIDLPSGEAREEVIQHVFSKYGRRGAAMCAEVITYRDRSAAREVGKALGLSPEQVRQFAPQAGADTPPRVRHWVKLCAQIQDLPRHLSQHSGGMILAAGNLDEVVPIEPAAMAGRRVIQWDKNDAEALGLIKIDLLGLGMLAALEEAQSLLGPSFDIAHLPPDDPAVYDLCCGGGVPSQPTGEGQGATRSTETPDTIGVFQIESRAQIATLPRQQPRCFYDLVVEVGLIRPGPLVGQMVNPYLRRRQGREPVSYPHPSLKPILERTLGFPLFQEQLLRVAMTLAGFSGGEAEQLRRAMTHKRSAERMAQFERRFVEGAEQRGVAPAAAREAWTWFSGFAEYGFPESHAFAFAYWVYASAYLKAHHPAVFLVALLNAQPMGFYSPATLVKDAQRHGVDVRPPCARASGWDSALEAGAVRLGLRTVRGLGAKAGARFLAGRPFASLRDFAGRAGFTLAQLEALAEAGAFACFGPDRRAALWELRRLVASKGPLFARAGAEAQGASPLAELTDLERTLADYRTQGLTVGPQLVQHFRPWLTRQGVVCAKDVLRQPNRARIRIGGLVITRQRPATAKGIVFVTVEDETGQANAVVRPEVFERHRALVLEAPLVIIEGPLQNLDGVATVTAQRLLPFGERLPTPASHDFR